MYAKEIIAEMTQLNGKNILILRLSLFILNIMKNKFKKCEKNILNFLRNQN